MTTPSHEHGQPAETKPAPAFYTHQPNTRLANTNPRSQTLFKSSENLNIENFQIEVETGQVASHLFFSASLRLNA